MRCAGEPAFTIAAALPSAKIFCTDLSPTLVGLAAERARQLGLSRVVCQEADMQSLSNFSDASADAVVCQLGIMFAPSTDQASHEIARVLKPGGTLVLAVWAKEVSQLAKPPRCLLAVCLLQPHCNSCLMIQMTLLDIFTELRNRIAPDAPPLPVTSDPRRFWGCPARSWPAWRQQA